MKQIKIKCRVSIGLVGCNIEETIEVDEDCNAEEIDETVREWMFEQVEWGWEREGSNDAEDS